MTCKLGRELAEDFVCKARQYADEAAKLGRLNRMGLDPEQFLLREEGTLHSVEVALRKAETARAALTKHIERHRGDLDARSNSAGR